MITLPIPIFQNSLQTPKKYVKHTGGKTELIDITFNVRFYIKFEAGIDYVTGTNVDSLSSSNCKQGISIYMKEICIPKEEYGINIPIKLGASEYKKSKEQFKENFNNHLYSLAEEQGRDIIDKIIEEHSKGREPIITKDVDLMPIRNTREVPYDEYVEEF